MINKGGYMQHFITAFKLYGVFSGRSTREEYWMFTLIYMLTYLLLVAIAMAFDSQLFQILFSLFSLAVLIPNLSITARRLHDVGRSGWWQISPFAGLIFAGIGAVQESLTLSLAGVSLMCGLAILLLVFLIKPSDEDNQYGSKPQA
jgi:uncharacterized membrane protein YhaH (DUF805 family)